MANKEKNFVSAIIYVYNAEERIKQFLETVIKVMEDNFEHSEIICVNDASEDQSLVAVKEISGVAATTSVSVINMSNFHGLEMAMNAGGDLAIGDFVFEFDNTYLDFAPSLIMDVYKRSLMGGCDIVSAVAQRKERFSSKLFYCVFEKYSTVSHPMNTESFRVLSRRVINRISAMNKTVPYRKALYANCGLKTDRVVYQPVKGSRQRGNQKEDHFRIGLAIDSLLLFTEVGYSFSKLMTVLMMGMSVAMIIYTIMIYATSTPVAGWTTTLLFLAVAFLGLFGILTIVIKYLQLLVNLVFKRKQYSFESVEKLTK